MEQMSDLWSPEQHEAWRSFLLSQAFVMRQLDADMGADDLPLDWFDVLIQLQQADGELALADLAGSVVLSRSGLTRLLDRVEKAGLITRTVSRTDRRRFDVRLTAAGRATIQRVWPAHQRSVIEHFLRHLTGTELKQLSRALGKLVEANRP